MMPRPEFFAEYFLELRSSDQIVFADCFDRDPSGEVLAEVGNDPVKDLCIDIFFHGLVRLVRLFFCRGWKDRNISGRNRSSVPPDKAESAGRKQEAEKTLDGALSDMDRQAGPPENCRLL